MLVFGNSAASLARGSLRHTWLENEVLNKSPDFVVGLRAGPGWPNLRMFHSRAEKALALVREIEDGFSPAILIDTLPQLADLPESSKQVLRAAVHSAYLRSFDVSAAARGLDEAATSMQTALCLLLDEWDKPTEEVSFDALRGCWSDVLQAANGLWAALDALPSGVVLP